MNMNTENFTFQDLYEDEAVRFIADRHHATAQAIVRHFLARNGLLDVPSEVPLEDNEMEILRGLIYDVYKLLDSDNPPFDLSNRL